MKGTQEREGKREREREKDKFQSLFVLLMTDYLTMCLSPEWFCNDMPVVVVVVVVVMRPMVETNPLLDRVQ